MPILRREADIYPADLFSLPLSTLPWEIVQVRSRQEKSVARVLAQHQQPFYLPQIQKTAKRNGRNFVSFLPLFPGYIFIRQTPEMQGILRSSSGVARAIPVSDQILLATELQQIRRLQESGATLVTAPQIMPGDAVRVTDGIFKGYIGTVTREAGAVRLVVSITAVHFSVIAEFPRDSVVIHSDRPRAHR
jgi:transcriptional antiterminator RfaH